MMNKKSYFQCSIPGMMQLLYIFPLLLLSVSCSKSTDTVDEGKGNISLRIGGIEEYVVVADLNKTAAAGKTKEGLYDNLLSYGEFDAITDFEVSIPVSEVSATHAVLDKQASLGNGINKEKLRANTPSSAMADTVTYRLILYDKANVAAGPVYNEELAVGERPDVQLPIGQEYIWVAYSLNKGGTVPNIANNRIPQAALANQDFLFRKGEIKIQAGVNYLEVVLQRWTTKFDVEIDVRGMFARIDPSTKFNLKSNTNLVGYSSDFHVLDETYTGTAVASEISVPSSITGTFSGAVKTISFYSAPVASAQSAIAANSLKVEFPTLALKMDDGTTTRTFTNQVVNLTHSSLTLSRGKKYTITSKLVESAVQISGSTVKWARSNLWYSASAADKYRFRVSPHQRDFATEATQEFWRFGTETPDASTYTAVDPCTKVYPETLWRMPYASEFTDLNRAALTGRQVNGLFIKNHPNESGNAYNYNLGLDVIGLVGASLSVERAPMQMIAKYNRVAPAANPTYATNYNLPNTGMDDLYLSMIGRKNASGQTIDNTFYQKPISATVSVLGIPTPVNLLPWIDAQGYYWARETSFGTNASTVAPKYFKNTYSKNDIAAIDLLSALNVEITIYDAYRASVETASAGSWNQRMLIRCVRAQ